MTRQQLLEAKSKILQDAITIGCNDSAVQESRQIAYHMILTELDLGQGPTFDCDNRLNAALEALDQIDISAAKEIIGDMLEEIRANK